MAETLVDDNINKWVFEYVSAPAFAVAIFTHMLFGAVSYGSYCDFDILKLSFQVEY